MGEEGLFNNNTVIRKDKSWIHFIPNTKIKPDELKVYI